MKKTTQKLLELFTSNITKKFTLREVSKQLNMNVSLTHRTIQELKKTNTLTLDENNLLKLNYKTNHDLLIFVEYQKRNNYFKTNKTLKLFAEEINKKIKETSFILILFGSSVILKTPRDVDILLIVDHKSKIEFNEKFLLNIAANYNLPIEERVISIESVQEMLQKRDEINLINEILNKHLILYGAEQFYRILERER
ncbi:MAG: hypothetical protein PHU51_01990 [Candidatus Nanoarchaeia archaeon]|nr:hypothetical protein [Candidatus Nanoarchaeia archaeon]